MSSPSPSPSSSTPRDTNPATATVTASPNPQPRKPHTSKFIEGPMHDEPSQPPPQRFLTSHPTARSISETQDTEQAAMAADRHPPRSASEPLEASSPKPSEVSAPPPPPPPTTPSNTNKPANFSLSPSPEIHR
ncbi:hypothetical protein EAE96_006489 [Botrytis aclada]|nr:hypothetical protein EAE96_006489 [Botrytis aclada]